MPDSKRVAVFKKPHNRKLGEGIYTFSLPADLDNCPGMSSVCNGICYAGRGHFAWPKMQQALLAARKLTEHEQFVNWAISDVRRYGINVVRIHVSGDFYRAETGAPDAYIHKWISIIKKTPNTRYFAYTRSWRIPELVPALTSLSKLTNMQLWLSTDRSTGPAPQLSTRVRQAYVAAYPGDSLLLPVETNLVFRNIDRHIVQKKIDGVQVCPVEDGVTRSAQITCTKCGICWKEPKQALVQLR